MKAKVGRPIALAITLTFVAALTVTIVYTRVVQPRDDTGNVKSDDDLDQLRISPSDADNLANMIRGYADSHAFNGAILVQQDGKVIYQQSFGIADRAFDIPIRNDTRFRIASVTKIFTAVLVLQLLEQGKIDLDRSIRTYLPTYKGEAGDKATIRTLLNHTSGMKNFDAEIKSDDDGLRNGVPHYQLPFDSDQLVHQFCSGKLRNEPGKVFDYNNGEYIILGKIIEKISGNPYERVLQERILSPLRMADTGMANHRDIVKNLTKTYMTKKEGKAVFNDIPIYFENWFASGSMYSTVSDLLTFATTLFGTKLIMPQSLEQMLRPGLNEYGYSVWVGETTFGGKRYRTVNRPGGILGANASLRHFNGINCDASVNIIILSNTDATNLDDFSYQIGKTLLDHKW
jgi:CubicO group peptidase (beta-lactamase class C family)